MCYRVVMSERRQCYKRFKGVVRDDPAALAILMASVSVVSLRVVGQVPPPPPTQTMLTMEPKWPDT